MDSPTFGDARERPRRSMLRLPRAHPSLASRILGLVLGATVCVALVATWASARGFGRLARVYADATLPVTLAAAEQALAGWYGARTAELARLASDPRRGSGELQPALEALLRDARAYLALAVCEELGPGSADGSTTLRPVAIAGAPPAPDPCVLPPVQPDLPRVAPAARAVAQGPVLGPIRFVAGVRMQAARAPIVSTRGRPSAWLVAWLDLDGVDAVLRAAPHGIARELVLMDGTGRVVASGAPQSIGSRRVLAGSDGLEGGRDAGGAPVLARSRPFSVWGAHVRAEAPAAALMGPALRAVEGPALLYVGVVAACCLAAFGLGLSVVRPIRALCEGARRLARGELESGIPESTRDDELGLLIRSFNRMARKLAHSREELEQGRVRIEAANADLQRRNEELQLLNDRLEQLSVTDGLTELYNHRYFQEQLTREISRAERSRELLALVLIDIDNFKQLNDRHGHATGDAVLRRVAHAMRGLTRDSDVLARYGGEEFALVPRQATLEGVIKVAEKIRLAVSELRVAPVRASGAGGGAAGEPALSVTVSIGIALYRGDRATFFESADRALYQAKSSGKDCVCVHD